MSQTAPAEWSHEGFDVPSSRMGMWWFLASEVATFGGMIAAFLLLKISHGGWYEHMGETMFPVGTLNTYVLLTSSLTVVLAHHAAEQKKSSSVVRWVGITLLLGVVFLGLKGYEYNHEITHGLLPGTNLFWGFYYTMTGLHALHVIGGLLAWSWVLYRVIRRDSLTAVAPVGLYWHFVDLVWIFLYPLLYTV